MKTKHYFLTLLLTASFSLLFGQRNRVNYDLDTKWNFGLNAGGTWEEKELDFVNYPGFSGGLTLGRAIYEKEGRLLSFDLRGRLLLGKTTGWSTTPSYDSTLFGGVGYKNYKFQYGEGSLELVVNAHRLRERTGILLYGFGGIGLVSHSIYHNYKNKDGQFYDYSKVGSTASPAIIAHDLKHNFNDKYWEKNNKFFNGTKTLFMPSLGIGLGYQITPRFSVGVEHKITFGLNDNLDGFLDGKNDRYHYTNFNLRWNLFRGNGTGNGSYIPEERPAPNQGGNPSSNGNVGNYSTPPNSQVSQGKKPLVNITRPSSNNGSVYTSNYNVKAKVQYVDNKNNITFKHNGNTITNFSYNSSTSIVEANILLTQGANTFVITGTNASGSDTDTKTINYNKICNKPTITFIKPISDGKVITVASTTIKATLLNVDNRNMIVFKRNGMVDNNFTFNATTKSFVANVVCSAGDNFFEIKASNECGEKRKTRSIVFNNPIKSNIPPLVTITNPNVSPYTTTASSYTVGATVLYVNGASQIQFKLNGALSNAFTYNVNTKIFNTQINLQNGNNVVEIKATNPFGIDSKTTIIYKKQVVQLPPVVSFITPTISPFTTNTSNFAVNAKVLNVTSANQVSVRHNGVVIPASFNNLTKEVIINKTLVNGSNIFVVTGTNNAGVDTKATTIIYKKQVVQLPPVVSFIHPTVSPFTTNTSNFTVNAKVLNVTSANQVSVRHNGVVIPASFNNLTKEVIINKTLVNGSNIFVVTGTNNAGVDTKATTIIYKKQVVQLPPVVSFITPQGNPFTTLNTSQTISARVNNVNSQAQISLNYNGSSTNNFSYNSSTKIVVFNAALNIGNNTLSITASNSSGTDTKSKTLIRKTPCLAPILAYQIPLQSPHNHVGRDGNMAFTFSSANITSINQIKVTNNGYDIHVNLEQANGNIWGTVPLRIGTNKIIVKVKNDCGKAEKVLDVLYKGNNAKLVPPIITIQSPNSFPHTTSNASVTVLGKITHVSSQNNVQVTIDGFNVPFTYNTATKALTIVASNLTVGSHQVRVRASNNYGNDMEVFDLVRTGPQIKAPIVRYLNLGNTNSYRNPFISPQRNYTIQGKIINNQNVTLTMYVNGNRISNYTYNGSNGMFSIPVAFSLQGQGTQRKVEVEVRASNSAGRDARKGYLVYLIQTIATNPNSNSNTGNTTTYNNYISKADSYYKKGDLNRAKEYYQKAAKINPKASLPKQRLSEITKKLKNNKETKPIVKPTQGITPKVTKPTSEKKEINKWSTKP